MALAPPPMPGAPPGAPATPAVAAQPPIGGSPATGPTQNLGMEAKQLQAAGAVLSAIAMVVALGPTTEIGKAFSDAGARLGKMIPPGAASPQGQKNFGQEMMLRQHQMQPQIAAMRAQGTAPGGAVPPGGGAAAPSPAMAA